VATSSDGPEWDTGTRWAIIHTAKGKFVVYRFDKKSQPATGLIRIVDSWRELEAAVPPSIFEQALEEAGFRKPEEYRKVPLKLRIRGKSKMARYTLFSVASGEGEPLESDGGYEWSEGEGISIHLRATTDHEAMEQTREYMRIHSAGFGLYLYRYSDDGKRALNPDGSSSIIGQNWEW
jgi:hypothetical protein